MLFVSKILIVLMCVCYLSGSFISLCKHNYFKHTHTHTHTKMDYKDGQSEKLPFSDAQLHPVFVFPALSGASDIDLDLLVSKVAQRNFMNYIFIMTDR